MRRSFFAVALFCVVIFLPLSPYLFAQTPAIEVSEPTELFDECLRTSIVTAADTMTVHDLKSACRLLLEQKQQAVQPVEEELRPSAAPAAENESDKSLRPLLTDRLTMEALNRANRFVLTPHKRNFIMPFSYKGSPNTRPYEGTENQLQALDRTEVELQLSIKILLREGIINNNGHLYLGYTNHAWWQLYNRDISAPFRETNHQPELILSFTNDWDIWGFRNVLNEAILNHQSNGQSGLLSRSWNRIMLNSVFERDPFVVVFNPWYRLPESEQRYPGDARGDDNPDIEKYMGNFELTAAYQRKQDIYSIMLRNNFRSDNKGAVELAWSFPVSRRMPNVRGYVKYFSGYGQSLIDYDDHADVLGIGVVLTDLF